MLAAINIDSPWIAIPLGVVAVYLFLLFFGGAFDELMNAAPSHPPYKPPTEDKP